MKALTSRTPFLHILSSPSRCSSSIYYFSTDLSQPSSSSFHHGRRFDEESRNVRVSVWWDFENCAPPSGVNIFKISHCITSAVRANRIKGPIQITAFGDVHQLSRSNQEALSSTGVTLTHIPSGGKNSADRSLLVDLMYWVSQNPPPAHVFLISGDRDFATILHRLRMNNYNILLACPDNVPGVFCSAASIMWPWKSLVMGENLIGRHFNQPPDGPYGSWYGHYRMPLENPFPLLEQPAGSHVEDARESGSGPQPGPIPIKIVKLVRNILQAYPKGLSIIALREEVNKSNANLDQNFYGYKKFSRFLLAMPQIVKIFPERDGQYFVRGINQKEPQPVKSCRTSMPILSNEDKASTSNFKSDTADSTVGNNLPPEAAALKSKIPASCLVSGEDSSSKVQLISGTDEDIIKTFPLPSSDDHVNKDSVGKGFFQQIWTMWFGSNSDNSIKSTHNGEQLINSGGRAGNTEFEKVVVNPLSKSSEPMEPASCTPPITGSVLEDKPFLASEMCDVKDLKPRGFLRKIMSWFNFKYSSSDFKVSSYLSSGQPKDVPGSCTKPDMFSEKSFWDEMESFFSTLKASEIVAQSTSRLEMAQNLQKDGPAILKSLRESDLLLFVNLLISEKKWIEETSSQSSPFKLCLSLSSVFPSAEQSELQTLSKQASESELKSLPHSGVSPVINKSPSEETRIQVLTDCKKLVDELGEHYPDGLNLGSFGKVFVRRFGYHLDFQKLGYPKLILLLRKVPDIRIVGNYIIPPGKLLSGVTTEMMVPSAEETADSSDGELSDAPKRDDYPESLWEEMIGPVVGTNIDLKSKLHGYEKREDEMLQAHPSYELPVSEGDSSDSEDDAPNSEHAIRKGMFRMDEADGGVLISQIMDCVRRKEDKGEIDATKNTSDVFGSSRNPSKSSSHHPGDQTLSATSLTNLDRKPRRVKSYNFVSKPGEDAAGTGKSLIDLLGSLGKVDRSKMQS